MTRFLLLKGCSREVVVMSKLNDEVLGEKYKAIRSLNKQILAEAAKHLNQVFGFKVVQVLSEFNLKYNYKYASDFPTVYPGSY